MLINISTRPHPHIQHVGLYVDEVDDTIKSLLTSYLVPDSDGLDMKSFNIAQQVLKMIRERKQEAERFEEVIERWMEKFNALSDEDKETYRKEGYVPGLEVKPVRPEQYDGVLIGEDVPNYFTPFLTSHLWREGVKIYFNCFYEPMKTVGFKDTDDPVIKEPIEVPSGNRVHKLFLLNYQG